jgi:hypothetical protein
MVQPADELVSTYRTHAGSAHRAAQVGSTIPFKMTPAKSAAAVTRKRFGRNSSGSYRDNGHNHRDFMQQDFFMLPLFSVERDL